jgi:NOL1/NOP2/sun family putative RNA methylase
MAALLGDEYPAFAACYHATPIAGLRVNTLKRSVEAFRTAASFALRPVPWCPTGFMAPDESVSGKHPWHAAGLYYLQEPSAMAVAELLDPRPGECVLDLAAAPGGKATHIASLMGDQGLLIANEMHPHRAWDLAENLERWGARSAAITVETAERLAERLAGFFDRVLLDAPCSGEGMFRKSEAARREWSPALVSGCAVRQSAILEQAARLVRPGGRLVYSTCTFAPEENEAVIAQFLQTHEDFGLVEPPRRPGCTPGRSDWIARRPGIRDAGDLSATVRLWPHSSPGEGHFIAVMHRRPTAAPAPPPRLWPADRLPRQAEQWYRAFCIAHLADLPANERLALVGSYLYALPPGLPELSGLRFLHPGWWLGTVKKDRFEPSHALAMGLRPADARRSVNLSPDCPEAPAYLRGEGFHCTGDDGWLLVAVDGHPLGWGKRVNGFVKSHYPRGLRWT